MQVREFEIFHNEKKLSNAVLIYVSKPGSFAHFRNFFLVYTLAKEKSLIWVVIDLLTHYTKLYQTIITIIMKLISFYIVKISFFLTVI